MPDDRASVILAGWRETEQAATSGPWGTFERHGIDIADEGWSELLITGGPDCEPVAAAYVSHDLETDNTEADAGFIVTARTAMPALLEALGEVLKLADKWDVMADRLGAHHSRHRAFKMCAAKVREAITRELTGKEAGDGH